MKITVESTDKIVNLEIDERTHVCVPARVWEGHTESGIPVHCFITRIAPTIEDKPENAEQFREFELELKEQRKATGVIAAIPLRLIL